MLSRAQWVPILFSCQVRIEVSFMVIEVLLIIDIMTTRDLMMLFKSFGSF